MRAIAAIPPYASRPNSWHNKTDFARYVKYFPDGGGRRGRRPIGIIPRWTGKAIALPLCACFRCRWVPGDVDGTASHLPEHTVFACCSRSRLFSRCSCCTGGVREQTRAMSRNLVERTVPVAEIKGALENADDIVVGLLAPGVTIRDGDQVRVSDLGKD